MKTVIFLDRDGTINQDLGYVVNVSNWNLIDGVIEALRRLQNVGLLAIVSNQSGIARGLFALEEVRHLNRHMVRTLKESGVILSAVAFCSHHPKDDCLCRKPRTGLVYEIEEQIQQQIDFARSWMIGDKVSDVKFGKNLGTKTGLIRSRYWRDVPATIGPDLVGDSLLDLACRISNSG